MNHPTVSIHAISVVAPGMDDWTTCASVLRGDTNYTPAELPKLIPELLPKNERRRTTPTIKLALYTAEQAINSSDFDISDVSSVFASSNGDLDIVSRICTDILLPDHPISPTQFHNSVHNAPAGYWAIATKSRRPSNSISAGHYSFAAGLMEAVTMANVENENVLLVAYDSPTAEPLTSLAATHIPFGCALLISASTDSERKPMAQLQLKGYSSDECEPLKNAELESLSGQNPIAQALRLLEPLATLSENEQREILLPASDNNQLIVHISL